MKKVFLFSMLLLVGLFISQFLPFLEETEKAVASFVIKNVTLVCLAFIMIHVGLEFSIDKSRIRSYGWDYFVAFTAATLPWIFCSLYFIYCFDHDETISAFNVWIDALLLGRFASPTSAGILFSMLAAAGLENSWLYKKARVLAIFDDLDTIILLIPIKMLIVGFQWEAIVLLAVILGLIYLAWKWLRSCAFPVNWHFVLIYSLLITIVCETIYFITEYIENIMPVHIEILLPAFVLGCILAHPKGFHAFLSRSSEKTAKFLIAIIFMLFVGMSMPAIDGLYQNLGQKRFLDLTIENMTLVDIVSHVLVLTILSNIGKMFPLFCYRKEASLRERLALSIGMFPRGEVGAGVILVSLGLITHIDKSLIFVAVLSLSFNLVLTGPFIICIKKLLVKKHGVA
jgi:Kef-type K+ transport system membrane component KefB